MLSSSKLKTGLNKRKDLDNRDQVPENVDKTIPEQDTVDPKKVEERNEDEESEEEITDSLNESLIDGFSDSLRSEENRDGLNQGREAGVEESGASTDTSLEKQRRWRIKKLSTIIIVFTCRNCRTEHFIPLFIYSYIEKL